MSVPPLSLYPPLPSFQIVERVCTSVCVRSIRGITKCTAMEASSPSEPPRLQVEGVSFHGVWRLGFPDLDLHRLYCNSVATVLEVRTTRRTSDAHL